MLSMNRATYHTNKRTNNMSKTIWGLIALAVTLTAATLTARAETLYGVSSTDFLVSFDSTSPNIVDFINPITGLKKGQSIVDLSFNAATNETFALGVKGNGKSGNLYKLNLFDGVATVVDPCQLFPITASATTQFNSPATGIGYLASTTKSGTELFQLSGDPTVTPLGKFANGAEMLNAVTAVPEPGLMGLMLIGAIGMIGYLRVRRQLNF